MCSSGTEKCIYWIMVKRIQFIPQFNTRQEYIYILYEERERKVERPWTIIVGTAGTDITRLILALHNSHFSYISCCFSFFVCELVTQS